MGGQKGQQEQLMRKKLCCGVEQVRGAMKVVVVYPLEDSVIALQKKAFLYNFFYLLSWYMILFLFNN